MRVVVIGAGPVGCLAAIGLRRRGLEVEVHDRAEDPRHAAAPRGPSFNLTLTSRGLRALDPALRDRVERAGIRLRRRIIHHRDGGRSTQPYGDAAEHSLLSLPRLQLHRDLVDHAERAGATICFRHEAVRIDPETPGALFASDTGLIESRGDLLLGCDGAHSVVRSALADRGALRATRRVFSHSYLEVTLQPLVGDDDESLHVWPRGDFTLISQPNPDRTHCATLFLPSSATNGEPAFTSLRTSGDLEAFFGRHFTDARLEPGRPRAMRPGQLHTARCHPFHAAGALLLGDAAHAMLPFYGQGINCSFEDVECLLTLLDRELAAGAGASLRRAGAAFTAARRGPCDVITELSQRKFDELSRRVDDRSISSPGEEYTRVAFTSIPYDQAASGAVRQPELELPPAQQLDLLDAVATRLIRYQAELAAGHHPASYVHDSVDVAAYSEGRDVAAALREDGVPHTGEQIEPLLDLLFERASANGTLHPHPGFMAHVPSGGLFQGAVGDFIARALNRFPGVWLAAPGLIQLEQNVIRWFCSMLGYGPGSFGYLTTSGSLANLMGMWCAVHGVKHARPIVYASSEAHLSVARAASLAGAELRFVSAREDLGIDIAALRQHILDDRRAGKAPCCVVGTAGTTNTGAVDDLPALAALCREHDLWLHVDACFGGFFRITARGRAALAGIEHSDSIAVDAHKSLFLPHGSSSILVADRATLRAPFEIPAAAYLPGGADDEDFTDFFRYGPELSRELRGLTAWLPIKLHGIDSFERTLDRMLDLASHLASELARIETIEVLRPHALQLPVVVFRPTSADAATVCERICASGDVYVTTTAMRGVGTVLRACILNHRTTRATVDRLVELVRAEVQAVAARV